MQLAWPENDCLAKA